MHFELQPAGPSGNQVVGERGAPAIDTPIVGRAAIAVEPTPGPLIVEEYDSTVVVPPEATVRRDPFGNLVIALD